MFTLQIFEPTVHHLGHFRLDVGQRPSFFDRIWAEPRQNFMSEP